MNNANILLSENYTKDYKPDTWVNNIRYNLSCTATNKLVYAPRFIIESNNNDTILRGTVKFRDMKSAINFESILKSYDNVYFIKYNNQSKPIIVNEFTLHGDNELIFFILKGDSLVVNTMCLPIIKSGG